MLKELTQPSTPDLVIHTKGPQGDKGRGNVGKNEAVRHVVSEVFYFPRVRKHSILLLAKKSILNSRQKGQELSLSGYLLIFQSVSFLQNGMDFLVLSRK